MAVARDRDIFRPTMIDHAVGGLSLLRTLFSFRLRHERIDECLLGILAVLKFFSKLMQNPDAAQATDASQRDSPGAG